MCWSGAAWHRALAELGKAGSQQKYTRGTGSSGGSSDNLSRFRASDTISCTFNIAMNIKLTWQRLRAKIQRTCEHRNPEAVSSSCSPVAAEHHGSTRILRTVAQHTKTSPSRTPCNPFQGPVMPLNILIFPLILMRVLMQTTTKNIRTDFLMQLLLICANEVALNQPTATSSGTSTWPALAGSGTSRSLLQHLGQAAFQMSSQGGDKLNAVTKFGEEKSSVSSARTAQVSWPSPCTCLVHRAINSSQVRAGF